MNDLVDRVVNIYVTKRTKPRSATLVEQIIVGLRSVFSHALTTV